ncbi:hypothetical protein [Chitinibacter sp. GC72]|uniref:hypothetical protein n=1 Tax=Chitinibacter sp. GC72 TaxID=1526917 RepID=UPI0012FA2667|nr:hypothetical protein [Chitinibacter sp. GC72]
MHKLMLAAKPHQLFFVCRRWGNQIGETSLFNFALASYHRLINPTPSLQSFKSGFLATLPMQLGVAPFGLIFGA